MPPKRATKSDDAKVDTKADAKSSQTDLPSDDEDEVPICFYDGKCYRKNPQHFKEYRHPVQGGILKTDKDDDDSSSEDPPAKAVKKPAPKKPTKTAAKKKTAIGYASSSSDSDDYQPPTKKAKTANGTAKATTKTAPKPKKTKVATPPPSPPAPTPAAAAPAPTPAAAKAQPPKLQKQHSLSNILSTDAKQDSRPGLGTYRTVLGSALSSSTKISTDIKRMLLKIRKDNDITTEEHNNFLGMFGWTPDEYEIGEKEQEEVELQEEHQVLQDPEGFKLIEITAENQAQSKETETVWAKASAKFFQTMKKAQGNYKIVKITVVVNTKLHRQFKAKLKEYQSNNNSSASGSKRDQIQWGFHGSTPESIRAISKGGFKHPDELKKNNTKGKGKVTLLDDGYYGRGIYFSCYSDYAMWYSEERGSNEILLSSLAPGHIYQCTGRMDGEDCKAGYDAHYSPKGNEIIVFQSCQILPRYILQFAEEEAAEREQEDE